MSEAQLQVFLTSRNRLILYPKIGQSTQEVPDGGDLSKVWMLRNGAKY